MNLPDSVPIVFRVESSPQMGVGHVMRCLALAQVFRDSDIPSCFFMANLPDSLRDRLDKENIAYQLIPCDIAGTFQDATLVVDQLKSVGARWIVIDGYQFDSEYVQRLKEAGFLVLQLDDYGHSVFYHADIILNQNFGATDFIYAAKSPGTALLLGPQYALLRQEFWRYKNFVRDISSPTSSEVKNILVTLGGGDQTNLSVKILQGLLSMNPLPWYVKIVVGPLNPNTRLLQKMIEGRDGFEIAPPTEDMTELMKWADLAITAAGSTCWEFLRMGVPMLTFVVAANQEGIAAALHEDQYILNLGWDHAFQTESFLQSLKLLARETEMRRQMIEKGQALVDGCGAMRVKAMMMSTGK